MKYSIEGLRKFAHANANETWYLQFRKFYRKHGLVKKDFTDAGVKLPPVGHRQA